jgi:hypothetical protein
VTTWQRFERSLKDHPVVWALSAWAFVVVVEVCTDLFWDPHHQSFVREIVFSVLSGAILAALVLAKAHQGGNFPRAR